MFVLKTIQNNKAVLKSALSTLNKFQFHKSTVLNFLDYTTVDIQGEKLDFPNVWLRDNCQCEHCFHRTAKSRIINWSDFNVNIKPKSVLKTSNNVNITWEDGHKSNYNTNWLKIRSFTKENQKEYHQTIYKPEKITWQKKDFDNILSKHDYQSILTSDESLYNWLLKLSVYGVSVIQNAPNTETAVDAIAQRVGFTKRTHYGVKFVVQHVANTSNVAYLSNNLQLHTDLPYYEYCPGVNLLHYLVQTQSKGGDNLISDCHFIANYMKDKHPKEYKLLTEVEVEWSDIGVEDGNEFYKLHRAPVICLNKQREIIRINFSIPQRGTHFPGPLEIVKPWYVAHELFLKLNCEFAANFKTRQGDILVFDNIRVLHGRNAYEDIESNVRKLIGAYVDWDEIYSRLRCLKIKLKNVDGI